MSSRDCCQSSDWLARTLQVLCVNKVSLFKKSPKSLFVLDHLLKKSQPSALLSAVGEQNVPLAVRVNIEGLHNVIELSKQCKFGKYPSLHWHLILLNNWQTSWSSSFQAQLERLARSLLGTRPQICAFRGQRPSMEFPRWRLFQWWWNLLVSS